MGTSEGTVDFGQVDRFGSQAHSWWDPAGSVFGLHQLNPVRLAFIRSRLAGHFQRNPDLLRPFTGLRLADIGCGGGLVTEPMARLGFAVTGVDASAEMVAQAREHAHARNLDIDYRIGAIETVVESTARFDVVLALEVIEHVADRDAFLRCLAGLLAPGGAAIVSTLNRTTASFLLAVVGAEYILGWIPRGTHEWAKFVPPSELILGLRRNGLRTIEISGLSYSLGKDRWVLSHDTEVNYLVFAIRE